jgi:hypothetical protein
VRERYAFPYVAGERTLPFHEFVENLLSFGGGWKKSIECRDHLCIGRLEVFARKVDDATGREVAVSAHLSKWDWKAGKAGSGKIVWRITSPTPEHRF